MTSDRHGEGNAAYYFDGIDDFITVDADSQFNLDQNGYSIAFWAYIDSNQTAAHPRLLSFGSYNENGWEILPDNNLRHYN